MQIAIRTCLEIGDDGFETVHLRPDLGALTIDVSECRIDLGNDVAGGVNEVDGIDVMSNGIHRPKCDIQGLPGLETHLQCFDPACGRIESDLLPAFLETSERISP